MADSLKTLQGRQRAEFSLAKRYWYRSIGCQVAVVIIGAVSVLFNNAIAGLVLAAFSLVLTVLALVFEYRRQVRRDAAEKARRLLLAADGYGIAPSPKLWTDVSQDLVATEKEGQTYAKETYFSSRSPFGRMRVLENTQENCFFSSANMRTSAGWTIALVAVGIIVLVAAWIIGATISGIITPTGLQLLLVVLAGAFTLNGAGIAIGYWSSARTCELLDERLEGLLNAESQVDDLELYTIMGDYNAAVQNAPIIPDGVFERSNERLSKLWDERVAARKVSAKRA